MQVRAYTADTGGCGHYRLIFPGRVLQDAGYDLEIITQDDEGLGNFTTLTLEDRYRNRTTDEVFTVPRVRAVVKPDCDVVVLQRPLRRSLVECIPFLQEHGVAVVVELDDDFEAIPPRNIAWRQTHPALSPERNHRWLRLACQMADLVTCSTPALAHRYGGYILPNYVPEGYGKIRPERSDGLPVVGWTGHVATHPDDLQVSGTAVRRLLDEEVAQFAVVGDGQYVAYTMGLSQVHPVPASGFVSIGEYPHLMAQFDIGIVPLAMNPFNQAKSWLKGLEFASLGVPFVASPTKEYQSLASMGAGSLAARPRQWYPQLRTLIHADVRAEAAAQGEHAVRSLTYENHAERWWKAWEIAWAKRRAAVHVR